MDLGTVPFSTAYRRSYLLESIPTVVLRRQLRSLAVSAGRFGLLTLWYRPVIGGSPSSPRGAEQGVRPGAP